MKKKSRNISKYKMSPRIVTYYRHWINSPTLFNHPCDRERFYKFVKACIRFSRKKLVGQWLRYFLEKDLPYKFKDKDFIETEIQKAVSLFHTLIEFSETPFSQYTEKWYDIFDKKTKGTHRIYLNIEKKEVRKEDHK